MEENKNPRMTCGLILKIIQNEFDTVKLTRDGMSNSQYNTGRMLREKVFPMHTICDLESEETTYDRVIVSRVMKGTQGTALWKKHYSNVSEVQEALVSFYEVNQDRCNKGMELMLSYVNDQKSIERIAKAVITGLKADNSLNSNIKIRFNNQDPAVFIKDIRLLNIPENINVAVLLTDSFVQLIRNSGDTEIDSKLLDKAIFNSSNIFSVKAEEASNSEISTKVTFTATETGNTDASPSIEMSYQTIANTSREIISYIYDNIKDADTEKLMERHISSFGMAPAYENLQDDCKVSYYEKLYLPGFQPNPKEKEEKKKYIQYNDEGFAIEYNHDAEHKIIRLIYGVHKLNPGARAKSPYFRNICEAYIDSAITDDNKPKFEQQRKDLNIDYTTYKYTNDENTIYKDCYINSLYWRYSVIHTIALYDYRDPSIRSARGSKNHRVKDIATIKAELDPIIKDIKEIIKYMYALRQILNIDIPQNIAMLISNTKEFKNKTPAAITYIKKQININEVLDRKYGKDNVAHDGIYSPDVYFNRTDNRVVFVFKEVNLKDENKWEPVSNPDNFGNIHATPKNLEATEIVNTFNDMLYLEDYPRNEIHGVGYINVSKLFHYPEDNTNQVMKTQAALLCKDILIPQLKYMNPNYIVMGGTYDYLKTAYENTKHYCKVKFTPSPSNDDIELVERLNTYKSNEFTFRTWSHHKYPVLIQVSHPSYYTNTQNKAWKDITKAIKKYEKGEYSLIPNGK